MKEQLETALVGPPAQAGYVIRIIEPSGLVSSMETHTYGSMEELEGPVTQLQEKLHHNGVEEYLIYIVNQSTGATERTVRRRVTKTFTTVQDESTEPVVLEQRTV